MRSLIGALVIAVLSVPGVGRTLELTPLPLSPVLLNCYLGLSPVDGEQLALVAGEAIRVSNAPNISPVVWFPTWHNAEGDPGVFSDVSRIMLLAPPLAASNGDANGDGVFDLVDIAIWQRKLAGLEASQWCEVIADPEREKEARSLLTSRVTGELGALSSALKCISAEADTALHQAREACAVRMEGARDLVMFGFGASIARCIHESRSLCKKPAEGLLDRIKFASRHLEGVEADTAHYRHCLEAARASALQFMVKMCADHKDSASASELYFNRSMLILGLEITSCFEE
jgi:hypothetical protein